MLSLKEGQEPIAVSRNKNTKVALFATCLADLWRPGVAGATQSLLEKAGYAVEVPKDQTCCGQPNWNAGDAKGAKRLAKHHIGLLEGYDFVVVPSGSCADMIKNQYLELFKDDPEWLEKAAGLSARTFELSQFLTKIAKYKPKKIKNAPLLAWQDSCSCRRGLGIEAEPRVLAEARGYKIKDMQGAEVCCGFGGLFAVRYGEISSHMAGKKLGNIKATGAKVLAGADLGCLLNLEGKILAEGGDIEVLHLAELLDRED